MSSDNYKKGEQVRLLLIEQSFYDGLPDEDILALKKLIDSEWIVEEHHFDTVEIVYKYSDGSGRWIWVPPSWIKRI